MAERTFGNHVFRFSYLMPGYESQFLSSVIYEGDYDGDVGMFSISLSDYFDVWL